MKLVRAACAAVPTLILGLAMTSAQSHEPGRDHAVVELGKAKVTIDYGTPKLGTRNLDEMIKPGTPWRLGMNDPTTIETTAALDFGGKKLPAGKYTLFARPDDKQKWVLLVCNDRPSNPVIEAPLHFMKDTKPVDVLKITLEKASGGASLTISWGTYRLHGTFKAA
jgi:hypothetical protein